MSYLTRSCQDFLKNGGVVESFPQRWLLLTGKWRILTIQLETILEFAPNLKRLEKGYS